jgi:hypothetical protein
MGAVVVGVAGTFMAGFIGQQGNQRAWFTLYPSIGGQKRRSKTSVLVRFCGFTGTSLIVSVSCAGLGSEVMQR